MTGTQYKLYSVWMCMCACQLVSVHVSSRGSELTLRHDFAWSGDQLRQESSHWTGAIFRMWPLIPIIWSLHVFTFKCFQELGNNEKRYIIWLTRRKIRSTDLLWWPWRKISDLWLSWSLHFLWLILDYHYQYVPHKAVAEVSKIGKL